MRRWRRARRFADDLDRLTTIPAVRGIRRILAEGKLEMMLAPAFVEGINTVGRYGLPFEIGVDHGGLTFGLEAGAALPRRALYPRPPGQTGDQAGAVGTLANPDPENSPACRTRWQSCPA